MNFSCYEDFVQNYYNFSVVAEIQYFYLSYLGITKHVVGDVKHTDCFAPFQVFNIFVRFKLVVTDIKGGKFLKEICQIH